MNVETIREGKIQFKIAVSDKISKKMPVFYNPVMSLNRDIAVLLLRSLNQKNLRVADILAGSGVRGARFLSELPKSVIKTVVFNDANPLFKKTIAQLVKANRLSKSRFEVCNLDANIFLLNSVGFDYIDVDPFGSPNPFLDSAVKRLSRGGVLAVTATDTSALAGSHVNACKRKYWAVPLRNELMHEVGLRILIRKIQLVGSQFDKCLIPVFCHSSEHYSRVYFKCVKGKTAVDNVLKQHKFLLFCSDCRNFFVGVKNFGSCDNCGKEMLCSGPLWVGSLWDSALVKRMLGFAEDGVLKALLQVIYDESKIGVVGFYSVPRLCSFLKRAVPKKDLLFSRIREKNFVACSSHFGGDCVRTDMPLKDLLVLIDSCPVK